MENEEEKKVEEVEEIQIHKTPTVDTPYKIKKKKPKAKKKKPSPRGRKPKIVKDTKIRRILEKRGLSRKDLQALIKINDSEAPMSPDAISRIVNGNRCDYKLSTVYRLCRALKITPNDLLDWESEIEPKEQTQNNDFDQEQNFQ